MNFFAQQEAARSKTLRLILIYGLAVVLIIAALDVIFAIALILLQGEPVETLNPIAWMDRNTSLVAGLSAVVMVFIGLASLYRIMSFRSGGGAVARQLGGTQVNEQTREPAVRRYVNVVEEMAIAAGLPVPEIYVLENESGINAFAAGYDAGDAAISVTRGALDAFDRDELQGVIGHEFSHILNGDMRLNMRLLGPLFGIMLISMMGRILLRSMGRTRVRSSRKGGGGILVVLLLGIGLTVVGYIGHLAGRLIKAAISRQREYLADASAVQFTRNPDGIGGALKKIAAWQYGSQIVNDGSEEVSHMLFANGLSLRSGSLFATHPPLTERLSRLGQRLTNSELAKLAVQMKSLSRHSVGPAATDESGTDSVTEGLIAKPGSGLEQQAAATVVSAIPPELYDAAHRTDSVSHVVLSMLLDPAADLRTRQLDIIGRHGNGSDVTRVEYYRYRISGPVADLRLVLLELAFPTIRRLTWQQQSSLYDLVEELITLDGAISSFEYLLSRLLQQNMLESRRPRRRIRINRINKLFHYRMELGLVFSVLASFGQNSRHDARHAYTAGLNQLSPQIDWPHLQVPEKWPMAMDNALQRIDGLRPLVKEAVIEALQVTAGFDGKDNMAEREMLRVIAGLMHVPVAVP
jgi:Zn-dependent protease with chaperone function